ncbi:RagB/SusD family nutrient uptake outer membrane protein [Rhabdobacter roseus]|uniref:Tetratricopeptide (TPR) repeat protein n=1 Tax=Rhabdobacter roseus TaxID=1655419 RepID=A0A840TMH9_9BACT|nr:RagB/SusD family nutrient uptake outer membrane protein [Rhabdobacter roseus]MBB5282967.1 tetratricopeptide (TPR) repeat protein [Rhabdobacter roseus]
MRDQTNTTLWTVRRAALRLWALLLAVGALSCQPFDAWLDVKRDRADVLPETLLDLQALLDNTLVFNQGYPLLGQVSADHLVVPDDRLNAISPAERNAYVWAKDVYEGAAAGEFANPYVKIGYGNVVLERLGAAVRTAADRAQADHLQGQALFLRAFSTYQLSQLFCPPYDPATADREAGLQLRMSPDPNVAVPRSTVQQTYEQLLQDAQTAADLLPVRPLYPTRASRGAAQALLAKVYLVMGAYAEALHYAELALGGTAATLLDYQADLVQPTSTFRFPAFSVEKPHPEILFYAEGSPLSTTNPNAGAAFVEPGLYASYEDDDLRKHLFFRTHANGRAEVVGRYTGTSNAFAGIALNELYLIRAECLARLGEVPRALEALNGLLQHRYRAGTYTPRSSADPDLALQWILTERRKELAFTGQLRWEDLRRLNREPDRALSLERRANGMTYQLPPNDPRYVFPLPDLEIQLSGIAQNPR